MKSDELLIKFMEIAIEKLSASLANICAIKTVLIENGLITSKELEAKVQEAFKFPDRIKGREVLESMINDFKKESQ